MKIPDKMKSKTFWLALAGAVVVFLQTSGVKVDAPYVNELVTALCAVLVVLGIVKDDKKGGGPSEGEAQVV